MIVEIPERCAHPLVLEFPDIGAESWVVDARGLEFVQPFGLVQLILLLHFLTARAPHGRFLAPRSRAVNAYLARMDFYSHVPPEVERVGAVDPESLRRADRRDVLIPLKRFRTSAEVEELTEEMIRFLQGQELPSPLYSVLWQVVAELCGNAASHAGSRPGAFLAAQTYQGQRRYLVVGDTGVGIRRHLANNPAYAHLSDDAAAIREAIKPGVSGTREYRGYGFEEVQQQAGRAGKASLHIRSGRGWGGGHHRRRAAQACLRYHI